MIFLRRPLVVTLAALIPLAVDACDRGTSRYSGYAEAQYTYIASAVGGNLARLSVERGQQVQAGDLLFELDRTQQQAAVDEAAARLEQARSQLSDMKKGKRPAEIDVILAQLAEARNTEQLALKEYRRHRQLFRQKAETKSTLDQFKTNYSNARDNVRAVEAQLKTARMGAREDEISAEGSQISALDAGLKQAQWNLDQASRSAPGSGLVFDTYFTTGEWVPPGQPVVSLLIPENIKVRFWVPETELANWKVGKNVAISCDDCPPGLAAVVSYVSPRQEYTPPVIFSQESRTKLVYMVEAKPLGADSPGRLLHPGQPVTVYAGNGK